MVDSDNILSIKIANKVCTLRCYNNLSVFAAADFIIPDNFCMAKGCNPNSGSSIIMTLGNLGCKNNVVKAINRIVPSDKSIGPYIVELYLSVHCSRTVLEELTLK